MQLRISDVLSAVIEVTGIRSNLRPATPERFWPAHWRVRLATDATAVFGNRLEI